MDNSRYDLVVIGSGPGGYVAAIRAAQLKMRVAVIERDRPGGVCLNWGCIPSKALLSSAQAMDTIRGASKEHGIETGEIRFDFAKVIARSRAAAEKLSKGVLYLFRKNKIDYFEADATITGPHAVSLTQVEGKGAPSVAALEGERILIAAGSGEKLFPGMKVGEGVVCRKGRRKDEEGIRRDRLEEIQLIATKFTAHLNRMIPMEPRQPVVNLVRILD